MCRHFYRCLKGKNSQKNHFKYIDNIYAWNNEFLVIEHKYNEVSNNSDQYEAFKVFELNNFKSLLLNVRLGHDAYLGLTFEA